MIVPSLADLITTFSNSSTVVRRLRAEIVALINCSDGAGRPPSWPAETCVFCAVSAEVMSDGISAYFTSLPGSSQMRMA